MKANVSKLPQSWCHAKISEITSVNPKLDKADIPDDMEVSFVPMPAVQAESGIIDVSGKRKFSEVKKGYTPFCEGDVLFAKITPCMENGKMAVVPEVRNGIGFGSTEFHVLRAPSGVNAKYVYYYVSSQSFRREAEHNMSGAVGQRRVTTPYLSACEAPLPPLTEQHRIVAKIEELFSELDKGIENLKTAQAQLKVYRQALLKHAFEGKLTAQWREQHRDQLETAKALQQRIQQERAQRYQQQLADWKANGGSKPKAQKPLPPLTAEELAELPELPEGWGWVKSGELFESVTSGSRGWAEYYADSGAIFIRITNMDFDSLKLDLSPKKIQYVKPPVGAEGLRTKVKEGDFLFSITGYLGMFAIAPALDDAYVNQHISLARPLEGFSKKYFGYYATSHTGGIHYLNKQTKGAVKAGLGLDDIQNFPVPLCSFEEQIQIASELELRLSEIDQLELTLTTSLQQAEALRQSILKKAFSGQLVPQDPHDEPASVLLARIRAERAEVAVKPRRNLRSKLAKES